jgi:5-methyltetrahydropteroyltriglutamate--homocysteine methyltransferase
VPTSSGPVLRSHVVGSILRPTELLEARERRTAGTMSAAQFRAVEDRAVDRAIALQEAAGIEVVTDGEQRRGDFIDGLLGAVDGVEHVEPVGVVADSSFWHHDDPEFQPQAWVPPVVTAKLTRRASIAGEEYTYARARASVPVKVTLPSANVMLTYWSPEHSSGTYPTPRGMLDDFADVLRDEIRHLAELGCQHIQIDAPDLTLLIEEDKAFFFAANGFTRQSYIDTNIELLNGVADVPGVTFSVHLCRGNKEGEWHSRGGYGAMSKDVFPRLKAFDYLLLEFDDERSGGFEPLADVPDDTCVVLGLVSTKRGRIEDGGELAARVEQAARFHPREQLAVSPQCGFASIVYGNPISFEVEEAKLRLVGQLGRELWS